MLYYRDRLRTVVNVFGDCVGVGIVSRFSKKQLMTSPPLSTGPPTNDTVREKEGSNDLVNKVERNRTESSQL